ncbi:hypothetical protein OB905_10010 [Halobacteria archaeon AArc-dxtr1]|nr:hypothetical protein [Halobacteria archaeon AArc-dxtr1]
MATDEDDSSRATPAPTSEDATAYGVTLTLVGAILLALAYYGVAVIGRGGEIGGALPEPFYLLAIALLFVVELLQRGRLDAISIGRALALAAAYGALFVLAVEGGAYLLENPDVALESYEGVTVFAGALVVAAIAYVGYLTIQETGTAE